MAALRLSSRFEILNVMDASADFDNSEDEMVEIEVEQPGKQQQRQGNKDVKTNSKDICSTEQSMSANAKKRAKKKKKQQTAELRDIAFNKIPSVPRLLVGSPPTSQLTSLPPPGLAPLDTSVSAGQQSVPLQHLVGNPMHWEEWKTKDRTYIKDQFEDDLQQAILASKLESEQQDQFMKEVCDALENGPASPSLSQGINRKERRKHLQGKDKPHPVSLQEFQTLPANTTNGGLDDIDVPKKPEPDPEFFNRVEKDATEIITKEERANLRKKNQKSAAGNARRLQFEDNLEKRDQEIEDMRKSMEKMKEELAQVKKRNKQLCFILAQGEMKDKADVLKQVDELTAVKDELTTEVSELHGALEQERSKVSSLKAEVLRLQERKK